MRQMPSMSRDLLGTGVRIRVTERGDSVNPAVLLIHDLFLDSRTWDAVADELSAEFYVVTPDLPGFGNSEKPSPGRYAYGIAAFADALVDLYSGLGLARAAIVGHGLGGAIGIALGARRPELVTRLVLVDAVCNSPPLGAMQRVLLLPFVGGVLFKQVFGARAYHRFFSEYLVSQRAAVPASKITAYFEALSAPAARSSLLATLRATVDVRSVAADKARLSTPALIVWGRNDKLQRAGIGQHIARTIRGAGFEVLDAGHSPQEECPHQLVGAIRRFLRDERPSGY
jgi:pimeloyl-ACP methyl ester carboxylesterase